MSITSAISGSGYRICCCEQDGECDCDCLFDLDGNPIGQCPECCWAFGDTVTYTHTWGGFTEKKTATELSLLGGETPVQCTVHTYDGGSVSVTYRMIGCIITVDGYHARVFALEASSHKGSVFYNKVMNRYEWGGSCSSAGGNWCYPLWDCLVLFCGIGGAGPFKWEAANASLEEFFEFRYCVARVCESCAAAPETSSVGPACDLDGNGALVGEGWSDDHCGALSNPSQNVCPCWCNDCTKDVFDCGGMYGVCLMAKRDSACFRTGNAYSSYNQSCGIGCERDRDSGFWAQLTSTCEVGSVDLLSILPESDRQCLWRADVECCQKKKTMPPNSVGYDVSEPDEPTAEYPEVSGDCPPRSAVVTTGNLCSNIGSTCDCNTSLQEWTACCQPVSPDDPDTLCESGCVSVAGRQGISCT